MMLRALDNAAAWNSKWDPSVLYPELPGALWSTKTGPAVMGESESVEYVFLADKEINHHQSRLAFLCKDVVPTIFHLHCVVVVAVCQTKVFLVVFQKIIVIKFTTKGNIIVLGK